MLFNQFAVLLAASSVIASPAFRHATLVKRECFSPEECPSATNGKATCRAPGVCGIACNNGYTLDNQGGCECDPDSCQIYKYGSGSCSNNQCTISCDEGFEVIEEDSGYIGCIPSEGACTNDSDCPEVANTRDTSCNSRTCEYECAEGFELSGGPLNPTCSATSPGSCDSGFERVGDQCLPTCPEGLQRASDGSCVDTATDLNNCGSIGRTCSGSGDGYVPGTATCSNGVCNVQCKPNSIKTGTNCVQCQGQIDGNGNCQRVFGCSTKRECVNSTGNSEAYCYIDGSVRACFAPSTNDNGKTEGSSCGSNRLGDDYDCGTGLVCYNQICQKPTQNNPTMCGSAGSCPGPNNGIATCVNGKCGISCTSGAQIGDTCVESCRDGAVLQGGSCQRYQCSTDAECVDKTKLATASCQLNFCFAPSTNMNGRDHGAGCGSGQFGDDNQCDEGLICLQNKCQYDLKTDVNNCGQAGTQCSIPNGQAVCRAGECELSGCNPGYVKNTMGDACVLDGSGQPKLRHRKRKIDTSLCPLGETACPIAGAASFALAQGQAVLAGSHGWECLDIASDVTSCGGCSSTNRDLDCTNLPHAQGVGCEAGRCTIFSCQAGYSVSVNGSSCDAVRPPIKSPSRKLKLRSRI